MKKTFHYLFHKTLIIILLLAPYWVKGDDVLLRKVELNKQKSTVYELMITLSEKFGYQFIYDSKLIDNNKVVKFPKGKYTLDEAIYAITKNKQLKTRVIGNHILLYLLNETNSNERHEQFESIDTVNYFMVEGILYDRISNEPIPYVSINVENTSIGTISNLDGYFKLKLADTLRLSQLRFSHLGYQTQDIQVEPLIGQHVNIALNPLIISLQEVVVRVVNPISFLQQMIHSIESNYAITPVVLTTFYREGVNYKNKNIDLAEGVFKIYKSAHKGNTIRDQVKLLKMRHIVDRHSANELVTKIKSGINTCLMLDIMKYVPDFFNAQNFHYYTYAHVDITEFDGRTVNVISFEQKQDVIEPLYKGTLYIDAETYALLQADFEVHPRYVTQAASLFVLKESRDVKLTPQKVTYVVSYKPLNGRYYINHVRGDLYFKAKFKKRLFPTDVHTWFEMVTCDVDTTNIAPFSRSERLSVNTIFSNTKFVYDDKFWGSFNVIMPENKLREMILLNLSKESEVNINQLDEKQIVQSK